MKLSEYLKTWRGMQKEAMFNRLAIGALAAAVFTLSIAVANKEEIVVFEPPYPVDKKMAVYKNSADDVYKENWALAVSEIVGNVNPSHDKFLKERLSVLLHPSIAGEVLTKLNDEMHNMKLDRVSFSFQPREILTDSALNKIFVTGIQQMYSIEGGMVKRERMTYEMRIDIDKFRPRITQFNAYAGTPKTTKYIMKTEDRLEKAEEKEGKKNGE